MPIWNDNDKENFEPITCAIGELAKELPADVFCGLVEAACGVFYVPATVMGHARRGLRDLLAEVGKWQDPRAW